jgi:hypothetical protein
MLLSQQDDKAESERFTTNAPIIDQNNKSRNADPMMELDFDSDFEPLDRETPSLAPISACVDDIPTLALEDGENTTVWLSLAVVGAAAVGGIAFVMGQNGQRERQRRSTH